MFKKMSIGVKLISAFMCIAVVVLVAGAFQYIKLTEMNTQNQQLAEGNDRVDAMNDMLLASQSMARQGMEILAASKADEFKAAVDSYNENANILKVSAECVTNGGENLRGVKILPTPNPEVKSLVKDVLSFLPEYNKFADEMKELVQKRISGSNEAELTTKLHHAEDGMDGVGSKLRENLTAARVKIWANIGAKSKEVAETTKATMTATISSIILSIVLAIAFGIFISMMITKQMNVVINDLQQVTQGVNTGAQQISSASGQVSDSSQSIAEGANNQAASLEETSASLEQMSAMVKQNADNSKQAASMSTTTSKSAQKGMEAMGRMSSAIEKIKASSDETAKIIKTIDEIAFQTNLLALNAAVEAARAGEAGKGFAVVAEEVRNLAQRSAEAAKNTAELIEGSQKNAENGVTVSGEVGGILNDIVEGIQKVGQLINEVSAATDEQSHGLDEINKAVAELDKVTQGNAANAEETASASEQLSAQASELGDHVRRLKTVVQTTRELIAGSSGASHDYDDEIETPAPPVRHARNAKQVTPKKFIQNAQPAKKFYSKRDNDSQEKGHREAAPHRRIAESKDLIPLDDDDLSQF